MPYVQQANPWDAVAQGITAYGQNKQQKSVTDQAQNEQRIQTLIAALPALKTNPELGTDPSFQKLFGDTLGGVNPGIIPQSPENMLSDLINKRKIATLTTPATTPVAQNKADIVAGMPTDSQAAAPDVALAGAQQNVDAGALALNEARMKDNALSALNPRQLADHFGFKPGEQLTAEDEVQLQKSAFQSDALRAAHKALSSDPQFRNLSAAEQAGILPFFVERERNQGEWARTSLQVGDKNSQAMKLIFDGAEQEYRTKMNEWQKNTQQIQNAYMLATGKDKTKYGEQLTKLQNDMPTLDYQNYSKRLGVDFNDVTSAVVSSLARGQGNRSGKATAAIGGTAPASLAHVQSAASLIKSGVSPGDPRVSSILDTLSPAELGQVEGMTGMKLRKAP